MGKWKSFCAAGVVVSLVAVAVFCWLRMPVSDQELLANFAKAGDFFRGVESMRGLPWWSPNFLQGTSLAMAWGYMFSNVIMLATALPFGFLAGSKVGVACCLLAGGCGMLAPWLFFPAFVWWSREPCIGGSSYQSPPGILDSSKHAKSPALSPTNLSA